MNTPNQVQHKAPAARATVPDIAVEVRHGDTSHGKPMDERSELLTLLNLRLAESIDLSSQLKQAHWNVKGPNFIGLHELFDRVHAANESYVDLIAERIVQLGGFAEGTARIAAVRSRLSDYPLTISDGLAHVEAVVRAMRTFRGEVRNTIAEADELDDAETADLFTEISRGLDKWLWFVEAHAQGTR